MNVHIPPSPDPQDVYARIAPRQRAYAEYLVVNYGFDVSREIAPDDGMFAGDLDEYLLVGLSALHWIDVALRAAGREAASVRRVLDLPCGHGRVHRALAAAFAGRELVACDIERAGVDFCAATFGSTPVYSRPEIDRIGLPGKFDVIWVGSLFTHLEAGIVRQFLELFESVLAPGGVLVFTTAGRFVVETVRAGELGGLSEQTARDALSDWERTGFGFGTYTNDDRDQSAEQTYGRAFASAEWVLAELGKRRGLRVVTAAEQAWAVRQDVYGVVRET